MGYKSTVQILLVVIAVIIVVTYIKPTLATIEEVQAETEKYAEATERAIEYNAELARHLATVDNYSQSEREALERYMPDEVDALSILRDLETIVLNNGMEVGSLAIGSLSETGSGEAPTVQGGTGAVGVTAAPSGRTSQQFSLAINGSYDQLKQLLRDLERSAYPLEVVSLTFSPADQALYTFTMSVESYALAGQTANNF